MSAPAFDLVGFYAALNRAREARDVTWKQIGRETGVSQTTLSRMKLGRAPDAASLAALSAWAGVNPANYSPKHERRYKCLPPEVLLQEPRS
jgi:transcriptional regulator with XRE-family HTH domain